MVQAKDPIVRAVCGANYNFLVSLRVDQGAEREEEWHPSRFFSDLHVLELMGCQ